MSRSRVRVVAWSIVALVCVGTARFLSPVEGDGKLPEFTGDLDLGHGVHVKRVDLTEPALKLVVVTVPRKKGVRLRAVQADDIVPLEKMAKSVNALAAVNGDYHEMHDFLRGKTYSTLIEGGDASDLARYRVVASPDTDDASFWLDEERAPHISHLDLGASIGVVASVTQGWNDRGRSVVSLDTEPRAGKFTLSGEIAYPIASAGGRAWKVTGPPTHTLTGPAVVVRESYRTSVEASLAVGAKLELTVKKHAWLAIGTGPHLLENGEIPKRVYAGEEEWSHFPRTAVGYSADTIFLVATVQAPHNRSSMVEIAKAMRALGCTDAVNFDGGPSTSLWANGRLLNTYPDFEGAISERVGSCLAVCEGVEGKDDVR